MAKGHKIIFNEDNDGSAEARLKVAQLLLENKFYFCYEDLKGSNFFVYDFSTGELTYLSEDLLEQIKKMEGVATVIEIEYKERYEHKDLNVYQSCCRKKFNTASSLVYE